MRSELVTALEQRRDNDVVVIVPLESGDNVRLLPMSVGYDGVTDRITVTTELFHDLPEDGAA
jgi:hypothetical protein